MILRLMRRTEASLAEEEAEAEAADGSEADHDTGEILPGPPGGGAPPPPPPGDFRGEIDAAQREGAQRRREFEAAMAAQQSGAAGAEVGEASATAPGHPSPPARDPDSGPGVTATLTTIGHLARAVGTDPNDAVKRLAAHPAFRGMTVSGKTPVPDEHVDAVRAFLAEGGDGP